MKRPTAPASPTDLLRRIPQVDRVMRIPAVEAIAAAGSRAEAIDAVRDLLDRRRREVLAGALAGEAFEEALSEPGIARDLERALERRRLSAYRRVVNATGVILHTGLGRAVYPASAVDAAARELRGASVVEVALETGERNRREGALVPLLRELTGAEGATVVNNNAAATLLILAALARGREVIVSRGQLVEIGGSFRIPDILKESGARLVEVGTTNRTYVEDYRRALGPETALLLQVHTSNYEIAGFVHHTPLEELVALGRERGIPVVSDLGSGCFVDLSPYGFRREPLVTDSVAAGADLVCFSGDKLLGGPQAGVIVGRKDSVDRLRAHPLFRAVRVDKATLVLLEATLRCYRDPERLAERVPVLRAIMEPAESVRRRALACLEAVRRGAPGLEAEVVPSAAQAGSGALPAQEIPSFAVAVRHPRLAADELARALRLGAPAVVGRIQEGRVLLDLRTVLEGEEAEVAGALAALTP
ncbi:MAG: L-seryl-tRNA(Sec) selenium transferase [Planctomycetes bacterium]|nr:L-seryl-tRNA(Sec) selenium transferase [Planctomycetota bacterium]